MKHFRRTDEGYWLAVSGAAEQMVLRLHRLKRSTRRSVLVVESEQETLAQDCWENEGGTLAYYDR